MFNSGLWRVRRISDMVPEILELQREMNRLFSNVGHKSPVEYPAVNIREKDSAVLVSAELPGMDHEKLEISVAGDTLTIAGGAPEKSLAEGETYLRQERTTGAFQRTIGLPFQVNAQEVEARYEKGILTITLPRAADDLPKKIKIG
jgi:HSP20 family protein